MKTTAEAVSEIEKVFRRDSVQDILDAKGPYIGRVSTNYLRMKIEGTPSLANRPVVYWQEFVPGNSRDLRITIVGDKFAFGFWRNNRKGDFRASGSGSIDYNSPVPKEAIRYCLELSRIMNFDSMAYDLLFDSSDFLVSEMSYGYVDTAIHRAKGYFELLGDDLVFVSQRTWPQELWSRWALERLRTVECRDAQLANS